MQKIYQVIVSAVVARQNCLNASPVNAEWAERHTETVDRLCRDVMPGGAGFDNGTKLDWDASNGQKLVFTTAFHHMNDAGMYDGWTDHTVIVTPAFDGFDLRVTGRNRNDIKDYIAETFHCALSEDAPAAVVA